MVAIKTIKPYLKKKICDTLGIKLVDGMGNKIQSSSWLLKKSINKKSPFRALSL